MFKTQFGSHVYGTNIPTSDRDYKAIYLPSADDILLQRIKASTQTKTKKDPHAKNTADDIDIETFSLDKYLKLLMDGQTVALDMLFTPEQFWVGDVDPIWYEIRHHKDKFLHSGVLSFVGYCRTQANKYGIKGSRMKAVRSSLEYLKLSSNYETIRLEDISLDNLIKAHDDKLVKITMCNAPNGKIEPHLDICNRKFGMRTKVEYVVNVLQRIYDEYGERARLAEKNEGIDWKALMHAVRVQCEARELLQTKNITFPRPEKDLLLKIRKGEMDYKDVAKIIEEGLEELEEMDSDLPEKPDKGFAEELIKGTYAQQVLSHINYTLPSS